MHAWASNDVDITVMEVLDTLLEGIVQKEASMFVCMSGLGGWDKPVSRAFVGPEPEPLAVLSEDRIIMIADTMITAGFTLGN